MKPWFRFACIATILSLAPSSHSQTPAPPPHAAAAPIPAAILSAKTVFLSNAGADSGLFPHPFTGGESRGYDQLYTALASWNHFTLVDSPAKADLVFEIQLIAPNGPSSGNKVNGASDPLPMFRLVLYDRPTHYILWSLTSSIDPAAKQKTHDKNFDDALNLLVAGLKTLLSQ